MQLGTESRNKTIAAGVLLLLALILVLRWIFSSPGTPTQASTAAPVQAGTHPAPTVAGNRKVLGASRSLDPTLRYDWLKVSEDTKYTGSGRNIFRAEAPVIPKVVAPIRPQVVANPGPPLPPPPPPMEPRSMSLPAINILIMIRLSPAPPAPCTSSTPSVKATSSRSPSSTTTTPTCVTIWAAVHPSAFLT